MKSWVQYDTQRKKMVCYFFHSVRQCIFIFFTKCIPIAGQVCLWLCSTLCSHKADEQHQDSIRGGMFYLRTQSVTYYLISLSNLLTLIVKTFPVISEVPKLQTPADEAIWFIESHMFFFGGGELILSLNEIYFY